MLLTQSICVCWTKLLSFVELVRELLLDWFEVVWQSSLMWQLSHSSRGIAFAVKENKEANQNNTIPLWKKAGKEESFSVLNPPHIHTHVRSHIVLYFSVVTIVFLHCTALHTSAAKHNLYCQDRCYKMKLNMAGVERVVCLQMITCHNMFLNFPLNYHEKHKVREDMVFLSLKNYNFNQEL